MIGIGEARLSRDLVSWHGVNALFGPYRNSTLMRLQQALNMRSEDRGPRRLSIRAAGRRGFSSAGRNVGSW